MRRRPWALLLLGAALLGACQAREEELVPGEEWENIPGGPAVQAREAENLKGRMEYFYRRRAFPYNRIPVGARLRAEQTLRRQWPGMALPRRFGGALVGGWSPLGPQPIAPGPNAVTGRITAVAVHPTNPGLIYAGGAQGGVWRSTDGGMSWAPLTDDQCSLAIGSLTVDPVNPAIIYAGTGEANLSADSYYGCGVLRSTDGGATWAQFGAGVFDTPTGGAYIAALVVDRATAGSTTATTVIAATNGGVWRSTDSGQSWTLVQTGYATALVQDPQAPATWYAGVTFFGGTRGVYKSLNGGITWVPVGSGFPAANVGRIALALAPSSPATLYAAVQDAFDNVGADGSLLGLYRSNDGGGTWSKLAASGAGCGAQCWYDMVLAVDPTDPSSVFFGGIQLAHSGDGGASFTTVATAIHVDQHALTFDPGNPGVLYAGNDGGIYRILLPSLAWESLNNGLALTQFYAGLSVAPLVGGELLGGTQDNGTLSTVMPPAWDFVIGGDGGYTAIDYQTPSVAYGETQWGGLFSGPRRRDAAGGAFQQKVVGLDLAAPGNFIPPLVMDPRDPRVLYFGSDRLYRTADRGDSWTAVSPPAANGGIVDAIGAGPDGRTLYLASSGTSTIDLEVSGDLGGSWQRATAGLPTRIVTDIAVDPQDPATAYLVTSGFGTGHVFRTRDRGASWQDISGNLIDVPVNAILWLPARGELYLGTDLGVFVSTDQGATWAPLPGGLPNVAVFDLSHDIAGNRILAATHGRGAFEYGLPVGGVLRGDVSLDGLVSPVDAQAILAAAVSLPVPPGFVASPNGDASCDGAVTALDASLVLSYAVGLPTSQFCVGYVR